MVPRDFEVPEDLEPQPASNVAQAPHTERKSAQDVGRTVHERIGRTGQERCLS